MTCLDSNYFLRYLVPPTTPEQAAMAGTARTHFQAVRRGETEELTTEVVLHEVIYVLASKHHYGLAPGDIVARLKRLLRLSGLKAPWGPDQKRLWLHALDLYASDPRLGFADALTATYAISLSTPIATFDSDFDGIAGVQRWQPDSP